MHSIRASMAQAVAEVRVVTATSPSHFERILTLQQRYHASRLAPDVQAREGFVFARHSMDTLQRMAAELPQAIALAGDALVGYCLAMPLSLRAEIPSLVPMFEQFDRCSWCGRPLASTGFFVGGQVCVDRAWRGRGLLARLYEHLRVSVPAGYALCVTEIAARNQVSIRAHERMGFETIATYRDAREDWAIVAWDLAHAAILRPDNRAGPTRTS